MSEQEHTQVRWQQVSADEAGQRLDNYLLNQLKGVPKSMVYRIVRKGEVRVNKKRVKPAYRLQAHDQVRIPPVRQKPASALPNPKLAQVQRVGANVVFEDDYLLVVNKPAGVAVHGGSGLQFGVIEALRALRPELHFLELVHRLDRETSGLLLLAKKRSALRRLHEQLREKTMRKKYLALVAGQWPVGRRKVTAPLYKNQLQSGERIVRASDEGKESLTRFKIRQKYMEATLIEASPVTGRTHQIRVHCQVAGHPIAGDPKYGTDQFTGEMAAKGLERMFLHASELHLSHPDSGQPVRLEAPMEPALEQVLKQLTRTA